MTKATTTTTTTTTTTNLDIALRFVKAVEQGATGDALAALFHPDVSQREHPNRLLPTGATRDLRALLEAAERGQRAVASQRYEIRSAVAEGDTVAIEASWSATLRVPVGSLPEGGTMRASLAMFFTVRDGRIASLRNYDCYEPF